MQDRLRVTTLLGVLLLAASVPAGHAQSEAGGVPSQCWSNAISTSDLLLNYTRSQTSSVTTFSFLVQPKGALVGTVSSVGIRIASQVAAGPASITRSTPVGQITGPPPQFVWTAQQTIAQAYSLSLAADASGLPFYLTSLCQQGITVLDKSGAPVFQQPAAAAGQPGTCFLFFQMTDGSCGYQLLADRELPATSIPPPPPKAPASPPGPSSSYGSYYGSPAGSYGSPSPPAPLFGPPVALGPAASPAYGSPPSAGYRGGSYAPAPSPGYGGYYGSSGYSSGYGLGYGSGYSPATYGGYGSSPAAPAGGYYSATTSTLFGSGRSLLSIIPDEPVMGQPGGMGHFGTAFPSNAWQFVHHKSQSGSMRGQSCPEVGGTAEVACQAQRICGQCSSTSSPDASSAYTLTRSLKDGKMVYNLTASGSATQMPSRLTLRVGSQTPGALISRPQLSSNWLRGAVHRDCSSDTGLKHTITWEQAAIRQAWSKASPPVFQVEAPGDVDLFAEELEVAGSEGAQLLIKPGVALLSVETAGSCAWQALNLQHATDQ
ncbi:hypothetical protein WJX74_000305 [Apatococcus lobatus]|uniref:Uncharacterized protein n=1 Tax=Apatococcus lobatus TaxID=904363 RepID=A0AAW1RBE9_9CHLO